MAIMKDVTFNWAKVLGEPRPKYNPDDGREWAIDISFTKEQVAQLAKEGVTTDFYIKNKEDERGDFFTYRRNEFKKDGNPSKPITIYASDGSLWPQDKLIGNGSKGDILYALQEIPARPKKRMKPSIISICIRELKEYEGKSGEGFEFTPKQTTEGEEW